MRLVFSDTVMCLRKPLLAKDSVTDKKNEYLRKHVEHETQKGITPTMYQALRRTLIVTFNSQHPGSRSFYFHFINKIVCLGMNKMRFSFSWNKSVNFD